MEQQDKLPTSHLQELHERMDQALAEAQRGEGVDGETFMQRLIADLDSQDAARKVG